MNKDFLNLVQVNKINRKERSIKYRKSEEKEKTINEIIFRKIFGHIE